MKKLNKILISSIVVLTCVVGLMGVFKNSPVDIASFAKFATSFAVIFGPWVAIVAAGGESKRLIQTKFGQSGAEATYQPDKGGK